METRKLITVIKETSTELLPNCDMEPLVLVRKGLYEELLNHLDMFGDFTEDVGSKLGDIFQNTREESEQEQEEESYPV